MLATEKSQCAICNQKIQSAMSFFSFPNIDGALCSQCSHQAVNALTGMRVAYLSRAEAYPLPEK